MNCGCRSPCGERGLKYEAGLSTRRAERRSPCGERGLKYWKSSSEAATARRSPCGERGLKYQLAEVIMDDHGRSPCGERGLKFKQRHNHKLPEWSLPLRGAWIEISVRERRVRRAHVAPPAGSVD